MTSNEEHLRGILAKLPPEMQEEVASYAQYLLEKNRPSVTNQARPRFYICSICFSTSSVPLECHGRRMIVCNAENPEDCKPPISAAGEIKARAPRWFVISTAPK